MIAGEPLGRPENSVGGGLQHERTALAWERTAISMMIVGVALARYAAKDGQAFLGLVGVVQTLTGSALLVWTGSNYDMLHDASRDASAVPQIGLTRLIGLTTIGFTSIALVIVTVLAIINLD